MASIPLPTRRLVLEKYQYRCAICNIDEWNSQPITLEIDHIDGINTRHDFDNLRPLCPNCHSQTKTWRGRNIKSEFRKEVTDEELLDALKNTPNIRQALLKVGLKAKGGNYKRASKMMGLLPKRKQTNNSQYGKYWITDGIKNLKISPEDFESYSNSGWIRGRTINIIPPSKKGRIWITNGAQSRMIHNFDIIPDGWFEGRAK